MDEKKYGWINEKYIGSCLRRDPAEITKYAVSQAVGKGNNYASNLLRITVQLDDKEHNKTEEKFLMKCLPEGLMATLIQESGMWNKEVVMYRDLLPIIESYVKTKIGPKCLNNCNKSVNKEIVLEDLSYKYKMADRREQLDFDHCVVVMKKLAKFHAGSVAARTTHKEYVYAVGDELCFCDARRETNELYFRQPFKNLAEQIKDSDTLKQYSKGLKNFGEKFWDLALYAAKPKTFNVLNHGDLWTNNILFDYDESGVVTDARLIDFQCCRYTTPAFDLQYFFMSSTKEDIRVNKLHELIDIYVNHLNDELRRLGETPISIDDLYYDMSITDCYGLYASIFVLPISIRDPESIDEADDLLDTETENMHSKCVQGKRYQSMLPKILAYYDKKGLFDDAYDNTNYETSSNILKEKDDSTITLYDTIVLTKNIITKALFA